jgi:hypothetical protein
VEVKMSENDELAQKRQQIKTEIQSGKYKSLAGVMINDITITGSKPLEIQL